MYEPTIQNISDGRWRLATRVTDSDDPYLVSVYRDGTIGYYTHFEDARYSTAVITQEQIEIYRSYLKIYQDENLALLTFILNYLNGEL